MEVHGQQPADRYRESQDRLQQATRDRLRRAREVMADLSHDRGREIRRAREQEQTEAQQRAEQRRAIEARSRADVLELSSAARLEQPEADRESKVQALKAEHEAGTLNTPERIEQAAQRILEG